LENGGMSAIAGEKSIMPWMDGNKANIMKAQPGKSSERGRARCRYMPVETVEEGGSVHE